MAAKKKRGPSEKRIQHWTATAYEALNRGDVHTAAKAADRALDASADHPDVLLLRGHLYVLMGRFDEGGRELDRAEAAYLAAGRQVPGPLYNSRGVVALKQQRYDDSRQAFIRAAELSPHQPESVIGLGTVEMDLGNTATALEWFANAAARWPSHPAVRWGRSMARLRSGQWPAAWADYEARLMNPDWMMRWGHHRKVAQWYGQAIPGCALMVHHEQGMGDTIMLSRYLPWVRKTSQCSHLSLLVPAPLVDLLKTWVDWCGESEPPPHDYMVPIPSLPYLHATTLATVPAPLWLQEQEQPAHE